MWSGFPEPDSLYEIQFVEHEPFGGPWKNLLMEIVRVLPRCFRRMVKAKGTVFEYMRFRIHDNPWEQNPDLGNASFDVFDFDRIGIAAF